MNIDSESAAIRSAQSGDTAAFERVYRRYCGRVYALCLRMTGDAGRAEDLTQDTFVAVWEKLSQYRAESAFSTWLHRVTANVVLMDIRARKRRFFRIRPQEDLEDIGPPAAVPRIPDRIDLERAIAALPEKARLVFVLHDVEGWTHDEIGLTLAVTAGTSKSQLHRARSILRRRLTA